MGHVCLTLRALLASEHAQIAVVAARMRLTLVEVLGEEVGANMYTLEWLEARLRWHLDPAVCTGAAFLAEVDETIVGHTIVRLEPRPTGEPMGLISTIYVVPEMRRQGTASALIQQAEDWFAEHGMTTMATNTSASNHRLIALLKKRGYGVSLHVAETNMVHLAKTAAPPHGTTPSEAARGK